MPRHIDFCVTHDVLDGLNVHAQRLHLNNGKTLYIESKKFKSGNSGEYPAMREAIGQLMTGCPDDPNVIPVVAVPFSSKSVELAQTWRANERIRRAEIHLMLVGDDGSIDFK